MKFSRHCSSSEDITIFPQAQTERLLGSTMEYILFCQVRYFLFSCFVVLFFFSFFRLLGVVLAWLFVDAVRKYCYDFFFFFLVSVLSNVAGEMRRDQQYL